MARISSAISDELLEKCQITLKQQGKTGEISRRLQAIISAKYHNISKVASIFGMTRVTMMRWIKDFDKNHKKESKHFIFAAFIFTSAGWALNERGIFFQYIWPDNINLQVRLDTFFATPSLGLVLFILFFNASFKFQ